MEFTLRANDHESAASEGGECNASLSAEKGICEVTLQEHIEQLDRQITNKANQVQTLSSAEYEISEHVARLQDYRIRTQQPTPDGKDSLSEESKDH